MNTTKTTTIRLPEYILRRVDRAAEYIGISRNEYIKRSLEYMLRHFADSPSHEEDH